MKFSCPPFIHSSQGAYKFLARLVAELQTLGHQLVSDDAPQDLRISLVSENIPYWHSRGIPVLIRMDGVCHRKDLYLGHENLPQAQAHLLADGIVYQTAFSERMCMKYLGVPSTHLRSIIGNGFLPEAPSSNTPNPNPEHPFVFTASYWRPHKRLEDTIKGFLAWQHTEAKLYVAGIDTLPINSDRIIPLGILNDEQMRPYYYHAIAFLHLCWIDWCPNVVVEALIHGTPVICTSNGGTQELVQSSGIVIEEPPYDLEPCELYTPPAVPPEKVAAALDHLYHTPISVNRPDLNIREVTLKYERLMRQIIKEKPCLKKFNPHKASQWGNNDLALRAIEEMVKSKLECFRHLYPRLLLYGAGNHTKWLCTQCNEQDFIGIMDDDNSKSSDSLKGKKVHPISYWLHEDFDAVVISSDSSCLASKLYTNAKLHFPNKPILSLYPDSLGAGPFPKRDNLL